MVLDPKIFKDYDIRAEMDTQLDEEGVRRFAQAFVVYFRPKSIAIGRDMRPSSDMIFHALTEEFLQAGVNVVELGLISTDASYYAANVLEVDNVIQITASHNPSRFNGFKLMKGKEAVSGDNGVYELRDLAVSDQNLETRASQPGQLTQIENFMEKFVTHVVSLVDLNSIKPLNLLVDAGNGMAGVIIPLLQKHIPRLKVTPMFFELDGNFPNHLANPLIEEGQKAAREELQNDPGKYDLAALFDGDGDRMYLMDEGGRFVSGTITTAIIAKQILQDHPNELILYNAICGRVVPQTIEANKGTHQRVRVGHSPIKIKMKETGAIFAGEHSGHYFFRDFFGADVGLLALLHTLIYLSKSGKKTSQVVDEFDRYPSSGEINFEVEDKDGTMNAIEQQHQTTADSTDRVDGITVWYPDWWANVRPSNTQPLLRLNVEAINQALLDQKTKEFVDFIESQGGVVNLE